MADAEVEGEGLVHHPLVVLNIERNVQLPMHPKLLLLRVGFKIWKMKPIVTFCTTFV
ncbi:hypothetical protein SLEP1_g15686 [Rubroshorea leprosula]|uniref:Uncharacterized protein n=1 Tax=Rubroshorea leprosula TaxID=152421 RepID=A0AAV5IN84_9ROSI|nr:hypothetical protein SLEP1_g15686 [Rubroshorea leprosula]